MFLKTNQRLTPGKEESAKSCRLLRGRRELQRRGFLEGQPWEILRGGKSLRGAQRENQGDFSGLGGGGFLEEKMGIALLGFS